MIRVGAVAVPLDAHLGEAALEGILESSETKLIFTTSERADRLGTDASPVLLDAADDDERSWRRLLADADTELPEVEPEDVAALFYTSGTTGAAKGVPLSHRNIVYQLETLLGADLVDEHDRLMLPLPLHHVYPFVVGMLTPLAAGLPLP